MDQLSSLSDERAQTLTRRLRAAGLIALVSVSSLALADLQSGTPSLDFAVLRMVQIVLGAAAFFLTRRVRPWSQVANGGLAFIALLTLTAAGTAVIRNEGESVPVLVTMIVIASAAFTGWGLRRQLALISVALLAFLINAAGMGTLDSIAPYPLLPLLVAFAVSAYVASDNDRHTRARHAAENALRENEMLFRTLTEEAPVPIWMSDQDGTTSYLNPAWSTMLGTSPEATTRQTIWAAVHQDDRPALERATAQMKRVRAAWELECRLLAPGGIRWLQVRGVPRFRTDGSYAGHIGTAIDVTDRKAEALDLAASRNAALEAAQLKSDFLATMSHEIRTPMHGIFGMTELALDTDDAAERREFLERSRSCAKTLMTLLDEILDLSRIEAGRLELVDEDVDLREVVQNAVDTVALAASQKGLELIVDVVPETPSSIRGDAARLRQVLTNLLGNAVKFTEAGEVEVTLVPETPGHEALLLQVRDTGIGIAPEQARSIFEPFTQAKTDVAHRYGGTGLGLAITQRLVTEMGGSISIDSTLGSGATFTARLPMVDPKPSPVWGIDMPLRGLRVLLADDNARSRRVLRRTLESQGCFVLDSASGREALEAARGLAEEHSLPDVAILDVDMPDLDGITVARQLPTVPVILLCPLSATRAASARMPGHRLITKPVEGQALLRLVLATIDDLAATGS